jgi:hypothetical protein
VEVFSQNLVMPVFALAEKLPPAMFVISAKCVECDSRARVRDPVTMALAVPARAY